MTLFAALASLLALQPATPAYVQGTCPAPLVAAGARCGTVSVPENRETAAGRAIQLSVIILPALQPGGDLPPLFDIEGGPGLPAGKNAAFYLGPGAAYRARRPIVLLDQRGTGASNPLMCPEIANAPVDAPMLDPAAVARCRDRLAPNADLGRYGTAEAVADLDAVRAALGHDRIDIFALSYGTTVALRYMTAHPGRVRAALLMSFAPPDLLAPRLHAQAGDRALSLLFADCAADPSCRAAFPNPAGDLGRALARLPAGSLTRDLFMERLRALMYRPATARQLPWIVHRAAAGDLAPFRAATRPQGPPMLADGMFLSVTCGESFPFMAFDQAAAAARRTRFGDYRLQRQRAACAEWPRLAAAVDPSTPVRSETPLLIVSGRLDPVTPPEYADRLAAALPNARHIVLRDSGHVFDGLSNAECFDTMVLRFFDSADPQAVDTACAATMAAPPFQTGPATDRRN